MNPIRRCLSRVLWKIFPSPSTISGSKFVSWEECQKASEKASTSTHHSAEFTRLLAKEVGSAELTVNNVAQFPALLGYALGALRANGRLRVVDFGGGAGIHYAEARRAFGDIFQWFVVETPATVKEAKAAKISGVTFLDSLSEVVAQPDLCIASASLQYCPDAKAVIRALANLNSRAYIVRRSPVLATSQEGSLSNSWWVQRARCFQLFHSGVFSIRRVAFPVSFLCQADFAPLDSIRVRSWDQEVPGLYRFKNGPSVSSRSMIWI